MDLLWDMIEAEQALVTQRAQLETKIWRTPHAIEMQLMRLRKLAGWSFRERRLVSPPESDAAHTGAREC